MLKTILTNIRVRTHNWKFVEDVRSFEKKKLTKNAWDRVGIFADEIHLKYLDSRRNPVIVPFESCLSSSDHAKNSPDDGLEPVERERSSCFLIKQTESEITGPECKSNGKDLCLGGRRYEREWKWSNVR